MSHLHPTREVTRVAIRTTLVDDLDLDSDAARTVRFGLGGKDWLDIDLSEEHAAELEEMLAPYVAAARKVGAPPTTVKAPPAGKSATHYSGGPVIQLGAPYWETPGGNSAPYTLREQYKEFRQRIRDWGNDNGYPISRLGRIPPELGEAYARAEGKAARAKTKPRQPTLDDDAPPYAASA